MREILLLHKDIANLIEQVENNFYKQDQKIKLLFAYLDKFLKKEEIPCIPIGFKQKS